MGLGGLGSILRNANEEEFHRFMGEAFELAKGPTNEYLYAEQVGRLSCAFCGRQYARRPERSCDGCGASEFREVSVA